MLCNLAQGCNLVHSSTLEIYINCFCLKYLPIISLFAVIISFLIKMEALWSVDDLSSDEEEDASNRDMYDYGRRMFSFVIDIDEAMFDNSGKFMVMALTAMRNVLMKCVRESKTDLVSVVLFNTNDTTSTNFEHVTNFIPLGKISSLKLYLFIFRH